MKLYYCVAMSGALLLGGCTSSPSSSETIAVTPLDVASEVAVDVAAPVDEDSLRYGGIKKEYVVKGCKVTIYNDGPIRMINEKTDQPCNAPIPKDHQFSKTTRTYQEDGCTITESIAANGLSAAAIDCSKKK